MSIEGKHAYRFGYLKSEQWSNVRIEALAREKGRCQICTEESISNDAHHIWYPENIYETREFNLVILCRICHDLVHTLMPECKTSDEEKGRAGWILFSNAITAWTKNKISVFKEIPEENKFWYQSPIELRKELARLKSQLSEYKKEGFVPSQQARQDSLNTEVNHVLRMVNQWASAYKKSANSGQIVIDCPDYMI